MSRLKQFLTNPVVERSVVTFVEAFIPAAFLSGQPLTVDVIIGAVGAAGSVVYNTVLRPRLVKDSAPQT